MSAVERTDRHGLVGVQLVLPPLLKKSLTN